MHLISKQGAVKKRKTRRRSCYRSYKWEERKPTVITKMVILNFNYLRRLRTVLSSMVCFSCMFVNFEKLFNCEISQKNVKFHAVAHKKFATNYTPDLYRK
jgi:hypothetical protein